MTKKVINPPSANTSSRPKTCPTCGHNPSSTTVTQNPPAAQVADAAPARPGVDAEGAAEKIARYLHQHEPTPEQYIDYRVELLNRFVESANDYLLEPPNNMGLSYNVYLNSDKIFGCKSCKTHLASHDSIISRNFRGQHGKAFLFNTVVNTTQSEAVERNMTTGRHQVRDVMCKQCKETVGWKYDKAYEASEKYKEGKFILEAELLCQVY